jgi:hypothetical protein
MKKFLFLGLLSLILLVFSANEAEAQTKTRVRFARGAAAATLKGRITGYNYTDFVVRASAGQTMTAKITGTNRFTQFVVFDVNMENMELGSGVAEWSGELPETGDYTIRVLFPRAEARRKSAFGNFSLKISVR